MRRLVGMGILGASLLIVGALWYFTRSPVYASTTSPPAYVLQAAEQVATGNGDPSPTLAYVINTTRGPAEEVATGGAGVDSTTMPVYLVVMYGQFTCNWASGPAGTTVPTGSVVTFTINQTNTQDLPDYSCGNYSPSLTALESLGPLQSFSVP